MLSDGKCQGAKPRERLYRLADGGSLYLRVLPSGLKSWELRWKRSGKVRGVVLGVYPALGLRAARLARDRAKVHLAEGRDPILERAKNRERAKAELAQLREKKASAKAAQVAQSNTFERIAAQWLERNRSSWTEGHAAQVAQSLRDHVYPHIGDKPITSVATVDVLGVLDRLLVDARIETASRIKQRISAVFEHAALHHGVTSDPTSLIRREFARRVKLARKAHPKEHFPCIPVAEAGALLRALSAYTGPAGRLVRFVALTACRTGEARGATWSEIDFAAALWVVPAARMKARLSHAVPLSPPVVELLRELQAMPSQSRFLFPNPTKADRPSSENAVLYVLAAIGFKDRMSGHGFRSLFSTIATESGLWRKEAIEASLAHLESDDVRAAYQRSDFLAERRRLLDWWAQKLEALERG